MYYFTHCHDLEDPSFRLYHDFRAFEKIEISKSSDFFYSGVFRHGELESEGIVDLNHRKVHIRWVYWFHNENGFNDVEVKTLGGSLTIEYDRLDDDRYANIWLCGPAERVFEGSVQVK